MTKGPLCDLTRMALGPGIYMALERVGALHLNVSVSVKIHNGWCDDLQVSCLTVFRPRTVALLKGVLHCLRLVGALACLPTGACLT